MTYKLCKCWVLKAAVEFHFTTTFDNIIWYTEQEVNNDWENINKILNWKKQPKSCAQRQVMGCLLQEFCAIDFVMMGLRCVELHVFLPCAEIILGPLTRIDFFMVAGFQRETKSPAAKEMILAKIDFREMKLVQLVNKNTLSLKNISSTTQENLYAIREYYFCFKT